MSLAPRRGVEVWVDLAILTACWASGFTFTAMALEGLSPEWVVVFRQGVASAMLLPIAWALGRVKPIPKAFWGWLLALAFLGDLAPFYVISWGQQHIESGLASILVTTMPLMTLALAHFFVPGERMTPRRLAGFVTGLLGVALIFGPDVFLGIGGQGLEILAQFAVLLGAVFFAVNAIFARLMPPMDIWMRSVMVNALAFVMAIPAAFAVAPVPDQWPGWWSVTGVVCTGIFASGLATVIYFRLVDRAGPTFMSLTNYLVPPVALLAGVLVLAESPSVWALAGLALILAGIALAEWKAKAANVEQPAD